MNGGVPSTSGRSSFTGACSSFTKFFDTSCPVILAPLAGVSDYPFRRLCADYGACLTYVEMLSAQPIIRKNRKTLAMLEVKRGDGRLGVQVTGRDEHEIGEAVGIIDGYDYDTIDINMGCPVRKVVNTGCGSALLRDPRLVYRVVARARRATSKPLSIKIRLGWERAHLNFLEVGRAAAEAGVDWITVHGRTRSERYDTRVDLESIRRLKQAVSVPIIGNGDLFGDADLRRMRDTTAVDGFMISRGALGNPWVFSDKYRQTARLSVDEWHEGVTRHLRYQRAEYGNSKISVLCMRKHLLWYLKGWVGVKQIKEKIRDVDTITLAFDLVRGYVHRLRYSGIGCRMARPWGYDFGG